MTNTDARSLAQGSEVFEVWQPRYAARGIPTFPVRFIVNGDKIDKRPAVKGYMKIGLGYSTRLTRNFGEADGIGFALGTRSGLAVVDVDTADEKVVADVLARHGPSPLIARTPSGGHHIFYRHAGHQRRRVRDPYWRARGAPVDLLANGFAVAPPSLSPKGIYRFVQGDLDDLERLPILSTGEVDQRAIERIGNGAPERRRSPLRDMREHDGRNDALFMAIGPVARNIHRASGTCEQLLEIAREHNAQCAQPMEDGEVSKIVDSVWNMTREGRNFIGVPDLVCLREEHLEIEDPYALKLLAFLRMKQGPHAQFWCTNALAERFGWDRERLSRSRRLLIELGYLKPVRQAGRGHPALYRWGTY
jgi:hypothetical protein